MRTDWHDEANSRFSYFCENALKKEYKVLHQRAIYETFVK